MQTPDQSRALLAAHQGATFVIEGPPGTGKSQTIANIIAAKLAADKTVLFVCEKVAAIDAVHKRIRQQGLADHCLILHRPSASGGTVAKQLATTISSFESASTEVSSSFESLRSS